MEHKHLHAVAVIDADNRPVGIINRRDFSEHYAQRYARAVRPGHLLHLHERRAGAGRSERIDRPAQPRTDLRRPALPDGRADHHPRRPLRRPGHRRDAGALGHRDAHRGRPLRQPADLAARQHPHQPAHRHPAGRRRGLHRLLWRPEQLQALQRRLWLLARRRHDPADRRGHQAALRSAARPSVMSAATISWCCAAPTGWSGCSASSPNSTTAPWTSTTTKAAATAASRPRTATACALLPLRDPRRGRADGHAFPMRAHPPGGHRVGRRARRTRSSMGTCRW